MALVEVANLRVCYGRTVAVDDISFSIPAGEIFGFIGPNGAGKTSTMKVLATLIPPASGSVTIDGHRVTRDPYAIRRVTGFMADNLGVYEDLTVVEYLHFFAAAYRIVGEPRHAVVRDVLALTDLDDKKNAKVDSLS
ncbi:MAG: ABC transporter ATP-binding protein, partial [Lentisphaeria bacterium]|nr:ABC transporter ATP-binding protein [Lentisphaeria bacterium]